MVGVSIKPPHGSMAAKPTSSQTMKRTLGAPSGAVGCRYGSQSGLESRISRLTTPLNGLVMVRSPLISHTRLNYDSQFHNTKEWLCADAHRNHAVAAILTTHTYQLASFRLLKNAKFLHLHVKYTPIGTKTHPLNTLFLHVPTIGK